MLSRYFIIVLALFVSSASFAQKDVYLTIDHKLGLETFKLGKATVNEKGFDFFIDRIDYYLSKFVIIHDGGQKLILPDSIMILAKGDKNVLKKLGNFDVTKVEGIGFSVGVPSSYNNTDPTLYSEPNALAPQSPSMHWGWAPGYRFVALEGKAGKTFNIVFQMHGLWNKNYFGQTQMAAGVVTGNDIFVNLDADFAKALKGIDISRGIIDHGESTSDLVVLQNFRDIVFSPSAGTSSTFDITTESKISVYPNPSHGELFIDGNGDSATSTTVYDLNGHLINHIALKPDVINTIKVSDRGVYFVVVKDQSTIKHIQKVIIE